MKKIVFFSPAILFTALYGLIIIGTPLTVSPMVFVWIALFALSGILMSRGLFWGGLFGMIPGFYMMYMSTIDTGQILPVELPMGIIIVTFYLVCSGSVFIKRKKGTEKS